MVVGGCAKGSRGVIEGDGALLRVGRGASQRMLGERLGGCGRGGLDAGEQAVAGSLEVVVVVVLLVRRAIALPDAGAGVSWDPRGKREL